MFNFSYNADAHGIAGYSSQPYNPDIVSISPYSTPNNLSAKQGRA